MVYRVGSSPYASSWWMGDAMVTRRSGPLGVVGSPREWLTVRAVGKAHAECERALGLFEAADSPSAADYARMVEAVEALAGAYRRAARRPLGAGGGDGVLLRLAFALSEKSDYADCKRRGRDVDRLEFGACRHY